MTTAKEIGRSFKEAREKRSLKPEDVYQKLRIHLRIIDDMENGAFEKLAPVYMKSFIKKYADFLGLDSKSILEKLVPSGAPREQKPAPQPVTEKKEKAIKIEKAEIKEKIERPAPPPITHHLHAIWVGILAVIAVILIFMLVNMVRSWKPSSRPSAKATVAATQKTEPETQPEARAADETSGASATLVLKARGKVWVQVKQGDKNLFAEVMEKNDIKTLKANGTITVLTGKAENLEFTLNNRKYGTIAAGVVKNIKVSSEGIKIGDNKVNPGN